jgi:hypothetical protein
LSLFGKEKVQSGDVIALYKASKKVTKLGRSISRKRCLSLAALKGTVSGLFYLEILIFSISLEIIFFLPTRSLGNVCHCFIMNM